MYIKRYFIFWSGCIFFNIYFCSFCLFLFLFSFFCRKYLVEEKTLDQYRSLLTLVSLTHIIVSRNSLKVFCFLLRFSWDVQLHILSLYKKNQVAPKRAGTNASSNTVFLFVFVYINQRSIESMLSGFHGQQKRQVTKLFPPKCWEKLIWNPFFNY